MNKIIWVVFICLTVAAILGCTTVASEVEIDTEVEECQKVTSVAPEIIPELVDRECVDRCKEKGYTFKQWKCSAQDTIVCVCSK